MSDCHAFLAAIVARPDDDLPRLIYADYLDERGQGDRAEFIRLQCAHAQGDTEHAGRIGELEAAHRDEWLAPLGPHIYHAQFCRGFAEHIVLPAREFVQSGERIRAATPLRGVALLGAGRILARVLACRHLAGLSALHLTGGLLRDAGAERLADCELLSQLRTLRLGQNEIGDAGVTALANSPYLHDMRTLALKQNAIGDAGAWELARTPDLGRLAALDLSENEISPMAIAMLEESPWLPHLEHLVADEQRTTSRWRLLADKQAESRSK